MLTINEMLVEVLGTGLSEGAVAKKVGCTQPTIHRIKRGARTDYDKGKAIEALYAERCGDAGQGANAVAASA